MADEAAQSAGQPAQTAPQPDHAGGSLTSENAPNPIQSGAAAPQFDPNQVGQWKRHAEQYQGVRPLVDTLMQRGIKTPDDLNATLGLVSQYREIDEAMKARGLDRDTLMAVLGNGPAKQQSPQQPAAGPSAEDIEKIVQRQFETRDLKAEHQTLVQSARQAEQDAIASIVGPNATPEFKQAASKMLRSVLDEVAELYPDGHPLASSALKPPTGEQIQAAVEQVRSYINAFRGAAALSGEDSAMLAAAGGGTGRFDTGGAAQPQRPMVERSDDEQSALAARHMKAAMQFVTGSSPMSQLA